MTKQTIPEFFQKLYTTIMPQHPNQFKNVTYVGSEKLSEITTDEVENSLNIKSNETKKKTPGEDSMTSEILKMGGATLKHPLKILLNQAVKILFKL